jgi:hypothetical protein
MKTQEFIAKAKKEVGVEVHDHGDFLLFHPAREYSDTRIVVKVKDGEVDVSNVTLSDEGRDLISGACRTNNDLINLLVITM